MAGAVADGNPESSLYNLFSKLMDRLLFESHLGHIKLMSFIGLQFEIPSRSFHKVHPEPDVSLLFNGLTWTLNLVKAAASDLKILVAPFQRHM
jgi:hypothetical protein